MIYKRIRKSILVLLSLILLFGTAACSDQREVRYQTYVDSLITANYLNACEEYIRATGANQDDAEAMYLQNVTRLAENLESYYGLEISSDVELAPKMVEVSKKIYGKARFNTKEAFKDNNIYYVDVEIYPIDILNQTHDEVVEYIDDFNTRVENGEFNNYVKEDYEHEFASGIIDILDEAAGSMEYADPETVRVRIIQSDSNFYISNDDFRKIDMAILSTDASKYEDASETDASATDAE